MKEILLVTISALLGYIIFSAFSTTATPQEALRKIIEQPQADMQKQQELAFNKLVNENEENVIALKNQEKLNELKTYENIKINEKENNTKVELKEIDYKINHALASLKVQSVSEQKEKENLTFIAMAFLLFLLVFMYLRYQRQLTQIEIEKENKYNELVAKKEYAEKVLMLLGSGNLTYETEQKLLKVLDRINDENAGKDPNEIIYHPNPDIAQLNEKNTFIKH